ncbi:MAG: hypothetical protein O2904_04360 [bacterium]|nr:hypothetical protein [bacterium]
MKQTLASHIGCGLAHVQHTIDKSIEWGFHSLRKAGESKLKKQKNENKYLFGLKKGGKHTLAFLGTLGDAFYEKYDDLKTRENQEGLLK